MDKIDIKSFLKDELETNLTELGVEPYRTRQIFRWLYRFGVRSFDEMADIPVDLRQNLKENFHITHLKLADSRISHSDGTAKYLFKLEDKNTIEAVFLPETKRNTVCLSSQVGCKYACTFCASAPFGFVRNLTPSEILDQVISIKKEHPKETVTNLVFMGIGEPLDNYENVLKAIRIFNDEDSFNIGARKMTISTCGLVPGIERLKEEGMQVELSVSLHAADDKTRSKLIPINKIYPIGDLMKACRDYVDKTNRIITFEYVLIKGMNASHEDAVRLAMLLRTIKCKVNVISYNQIAAKDYGCPSTSEVKAFVKTLKSNGINATHRKSRGEDIDAGCGQLRISRL